MPIGLGVRTALIALDVVRAAMMRVLVCVMQVIRRFVRSTVPRTADARTGWGEPRDQLGALRWWRGIFFEAAQVDVRTTAIRMLVDEQSHLRRRDRRKEHQARDPSEPARRAQVVIRRRVVGVIRPAGIFRSSI